MLDSYQELLRDHLVVTLFLTMLVRPGAGTVAGGVAGGVGAPVGWGPGCCINLPAASQPASQPGRLPSWFLQLAAADTAMPTCLPSSQVGAGGNAGNQSAIKVIRGLATGSMKPTGGQCSSPLSQQ